ncbi:MAG: zf-HC2 domain-containing protein [Gemmatimonadales bacterium]
MTCEAFDAALPDYLEGTPGDSLRASVEGHLSECVRCASLLKDVENIRDEASALPDLVPSRDLWQGIEARIAAPVIPLSARPERRRRFAPAWMGVAAAALVVSTAAVTYLITSRSSGQSPAANIAQVAPATSQTPANSGTDSQVAPVTTAPAQASVNGTSEGQSGAVATLSRTQSSNRGVPAARLVSGPDQSGRAHSDLVYGREIDLLQKIVAQRKAGLDSSTVAIIERNLRIIDAAIQQSRDALANDPASRLLGQQLTHALDKKVELLRTAAMLPAST